MNVVEGLLSVLLIVAIIVLVLGFLGIKYGTLEKQMRIEEQDKLLTNYQQQIKDLHKKLREEKEKNKPKEEVIPENIEKEEVADIPVGEVGKDINVGTKKEAKKRERKRKKIAKEIKLVP